MYSTHPLIGSRLCAEVPLSFVCLFVCLFGLSSCDPKRYSTGPEREMESERERQRQIERQLRWGIQ